MSISGVIIKLSRMSLCPSLNIEKHYSMFFQHVLLQRFMSFFCCSEKRSTMAEIVEQVQEREAARVRKLAKNIRETTVHQWLLTRQSCTFPFLFSDKRGTLPPFQQSLSTSDSIWWATSCKRPPKAKAAATSKRAWRITAVTLGSSYWCSNNPSATFTYCPKRRLPLSQKSHHLWLGRSAEEPKQVQLVLSSVLFAEVSEVSKTSGHKPDNAISSSNFSLVCPGTSCSHQQPSVCIWCQWNKVICVSWCACNSKLIPT